MVSLITDYLFFWLEPLIQVAQLVINQDAYMPWKIGLRSMYRLHLPHELLLFKDPFIMSIEYQYYLSDVRYSFHPTNYVIWIVFCMSYGGFLWFACAGLLINEYEYSIDDYTSIPANLSRSYKSTYATLYDTSEMLFREMPTSLYDNVNSEPDVEFTVENLDEPELADEPEVYVEETGSWDLLAYGNYKWFISNYKKDPHGFKQYLDNFSNFEFGYEKADSMPRVTDDRVSTARWPAQEEYDEMGIKLDSLPFHTFHPFEEAGLGAQDFEHLYQMSLTDPFLIDVVDDQPLSTFEEYTDFVIDVASENEAWDPEDTIGEDLLDEMSYETIVEPHIIGTKPFEHPARIIFLDAQNVMVPYLAPLAESEETVMTTTTVVVEPFLDEVFLSSSDFDDSLASAENDSIQLAGYSSLTHNYDFGTYFEIFDTSAEGGAEALPFLHAEERDLFVRIHNNPFGLVAEEPLTDVWRSSDTYGFTDVDDRMFPSDFPAKEVLYCTEILKFKEETVTDLAVLDFQLELLKKFLSNTKISLDYAKNPAFKWDPVTMSYYVFNYSVSEWVRLTDFLDWAHARLNFLVTECSIPHGAVFSTIRPPRYTLESMPLLTALGGILSFSSPFYEKKQRGRFWFLSFLLSPVLNYFSYARSVLFGPRTPVSVSQDSNFFSIVNAPLAHAHSRIYNLAREAIMENTIIDEPLRYYEESPLYPYWTRLGVFDTDQYLDSVDVFDPLSPFWLSQAYKYPVDIFPPSVALSEEQYLKAYYSDDIRKIKFIEKRFRLLSYVPASPDYEGLLLAEPQLSALSSSISRESYLYKRAVAVRDRLYAKAVMQIISYDFGDLSLFRFVSHFNVQKVLEEQKFTRDYIVNRDPMKKVRDQDYSRNLRRSLKVKFKLNSLLKEPVFKPLGRLEVIYIKDREDQVKYIEHKYMYSLPKKMPSRKPVIRRI